MGTLKSGYIAILGRPNVGKSTFLNRVLGEKISIVSEKPQTTRNRIAGIHNVPGVVQAIFLDTPGIHKGRDQFNKWMVDQALSTLSEVDVALFVVEVNNSPGPGDRIVADAIKRSRVAAVLVGNKVDLVPENLREKKIDAYKSLCEFKSTWTISAKTGESVDTLVETLVGMLPEGPAYFPDDQLTDLPERFIAAETVREKVFLEMREEIPYAVAVITDSFKEEEGMVRIDCTLFVERDSQKGMLIGKNGAMLKKIGTDARIDLEKLLATKVALKLWVKVKSDWSRDPNALDALGYRNDS